MPLVVTLQFYTEFHKSQFRVLYFSISISLTYFVDTMQCNIASFADDNTPHNFDFSLHDVINNLEKATNSLLNCFRENHIKANTIQSHLLVSSDVSF